MAQIIKNGKIIDDDWIRLADDAPLPGSGKVIVTWPRWQSEKVLLIDSDLDLGLQLENGIDIGTLGDEWMLFSLISLEFPEFADGRAYSQAYSLRTQLKYKGEIRAAGDVLCDQMFYMQRVGFDSFEPREDRDIHRALKSLSDFSLAYQGSADNPQPLFRRFSTANPA